LRGTTIVFLVVFVTFEPFAISFGAANTAVARDAK
jgi:hypothetical protein